MFKLELSAYDALYLGKVLIDYIQADKDESAEATQIWRSLVEMIEKGAK